jgi:FkbM family methyltransferase
MAKLIVKEQIEQARLEVVAEFGEIYSDYGHDLFLLRLAASRGLSPHKIYDVGGSSGIWSAVMQRVFPQATFEIFEPLSETSEDYRATRGQNPVICQMFDSGRASLHSVALAEKTGKCRMTVYPHAVGSTSITLDYQPTDASQIDVPAWTLDEYISAHKLLPPDLLKIDTQGSELEILRGASETLKAVSAVLCECWLFRGYGSRTPLWIEVANFLREHDFHLFDFGWTYRRPSDQRIATEDMLFLRRGLAFSPLHGLTDLDVTAGPPRTVLPRHNAS